MKRKKLVTLLLLTFTLDGSAAGYYRCTDGSGNSVFSQTSCGTKAELTVIKGTDSSQTGDERNVFEQLKIMQNIGRNSKSASTTNRARVSKEKDPCAGISSIQLRNARVGSEIMQCHTKDDVRSMYGEPDQQINWTDGTGFDTKWTYLLKNRSTLIVYFTNEKVTSWSTRKKNTNK